MPLFATLLYNIFAGLVVWFAKYLTQKIAVTVAIAAIVFGLLVILYVTMRGLMAGVLGSAGAVHPMFAVGLGAIVTPRSATLVSLYFTFWSTAQLAKWKFSILQIYYRTI